MRSESKTMQEVAIGQRVTVPRVRGTMAGLVSSGEIETIQKLIGGGTIVYVRLKYGKLSKSLPFRLEDLGPRGAFKGGKQKVF